MLEFKYDVCIFCSMDIMLYSDFIVFVFPSKILYRGPQTSSRGLSILRAELAKQIDRMSGHPGSPNINHSSKWREAYFVLEFKDDMCTFFFIVTLLFTGSMVLPLPIQTLSGGWGCKTEGFQTGNSSSEFDVFALSRYASPDVSCVTCRACGVVRATDQ